jgi:hypothetical protein
MGTVQPGDMIRWAREAIGVGDSATDWRIVPTEHAQLLATGAPSLAQDLRGERPQGLAEIYEQCNSQANRDRDLFKSTLSKANGAVFFTAVFSALLLLLAGLQGSLGPVGPWAAKVIGPLGLLSAGLATMWLSQVRDRSLSKRWAESRAKAEAKRLAYFKAVMEAARQDGQAQLLALEYTRRFLLDNQIDYFHQRGQQHQRAADRAINVSAQAVFVASSFTALAGLLVMWDPRLAVLAGLGVIASAYAAFVASRSAVNQDRENAERYRAAEDQLRERKLDLDVYRQRAAAGDLRAVQEFFAPIFLTLEADHKGFLSDSEKREFAIGNMEQRLDAARESLSSAH